MLETQYQALRRQGVSRRSFLQFCSLTAASLGLGNAGAQEIAHAMETKPRTPVIWLHGLECTCCSESFIRFAGGAGRRPLHGVARLRRHDHGRCGRTG